jgi:GNAT superfamily N-acetyltransferase
MKAFQEDVELLWRVYNSAWEQNWGFVPMTRDEFLHEAKEMKQILVPDFVLVGEVGNQVVGFALALPDINDALRHAGGRLFPWGLLKILYYQRKIKRLRVVALGVQKEYRTAGVAAGFYAALIRNARRHGYEEAEMSWILEDNALMNQSLKVMGARKYKTYRIYEWN